MKKQKRGTPAPQRLSAELQRTLEEALLAHQQGDTAKAAEGYRKVLAVAPQQIDALMNLGSELAEQGWRREAIALLQRARTVAPGIAEVQQNAAQRFAALGSWNDAIQASQTALRIEPSRAESWAFLGNVLIELGREKEAEGALQRALALDPMLATAWFDLHRARFDDLNPRPAIDALSQAVAFDPGMVWARFCLGVALDLGGNTAAARQQFTNLHPDKAVFAGAVDSWVYSREKRTPQTRFFVTTRSLLRFALEQATIDGLSLELGVRYGISARWLSEAQPSLELHGFDSFQGLPEAWHIQPQHIYSTHGEIPEVPANVQLHVGLFDETLGPFFQDHPGPIRFANIDCDLYSSTLTSLEAMAARIVPGTVLVFDEYLVNDRWRDDEFKAFQEMVARRGWSYDYLAFSLFTGQAAIKIR